MNCCEKQRESYAATVIDVKSFFLNTKPKFAMHIQRRGTELEYDKQEFEIRHVSHNFCHHNDAIFKIFSSMFNQLSGHS